MKKCARVALAAFLVVGWFVIGTAAQDSWKSLKTIDAQGEKLSPKSDESAEKLANWMVGTKYLAAKDYDGAIWVFKKAIKKWPNEVWPYERLGSTYNSMGRYPEAVDALKQAIRLNADNPKPDRPTALPELGVAYSQLGRHEEGISAFKQAIPAYKQFIRQHPDDAMAHYELGTVYLALKDRAAALEEYKILKTLDKEKANDLFNSIYK